MAINWNNVLTLQRDMTERQYLNDLLKQCGFSTPLTCVNDQGVSLISSLAFTALGKEDTFWGKKCFNYL